MWSPERGYHSIFRNYSFLGKDYKSLRYHIFMERPMPCHICGQDIGRFICRVCGANVCEDCFNKEKRICARCEFQE